MDMDILPSPLPAIEDVANLNFWQSIGIASMIFSCHGNYSSTVLSECFANIRSSLLNRKAIILFNNDNRPVALATYRTASDFQEDSTLLPLNIKEGDVVFDYIISPFSSPLNFYRFLKGYIATHAGCDLERAYLLDHSTNKFRHIW